VNNLSNYLHATALLRNLEYIHNKIIQNKIFYEQTNLINIRLAFIELVNFRDAKKDWSYYFKDNQEMQAICKSINQKMSDIEGFRNNFAGHFDKETLEVINGIYEESFLSDTKSDAQYIMINIRMIEATINSRKGSLRNMFPSLCKITDPAHQFIFIRYLTDTLVETITLCTFVRDLLSPALNIKTGKQALSDLLQEISNADGNIEL
jgi:hypothetical protein